VTLIEDEQDVTWGKSFQMNDETASREYLDNRESTLGGYTTIITTFYPRDTNVAPFPVLVYMATAENPHYLGPAPLPQIAHEIATSRGNSGHNVEYLAKLALFMRLNVPDVQDSHLYELETLCCQFLERLQPNLLYFFAPPDVNSILGQMSDFALPAASIRKSSLPTKSVDGGIAVPQFSHLRRELSWHRRLSRRMSVMSRTQLDLMRRMSQMSLQSDLKASNESLHEPIAADKRCLSNPSSGHARSPEVELDSKEPSPDTGGTIDTFEPSDSYESDDDGDGDESGNDVLCEEEDDDCDRPHRSSKPITIGSSAVKLVRTRSMDSHVSKAIGSTTRSFARSVSRLEKRDSSSLSEGSKSPPPSSSHFIDFVNVRQLRCVKI
jgi:hypothetical protein